MSKVAILVLLMSIAFGAKAADADRFSASAQDKTVSDLVKRWASDDGRSARWESAVDFPIKDFKELNRVARLGSAENVSVAFARLSKAIENDVPENAPPLFACEFKDKVVIIVRSVGQPECGKPLK